MNLPAVSFAVLALATFAETLLLRAMLRECAWLARLYRASPVTRDAMELTLGARLPTFRLPGLGADCVTDGDLRGRLAVILFIGSADIASISDGDLRTMVHGLFTHAEECLYIVCECRHEDALWLRQRGHFLATYGSDVTLLVDESSELRTKLGIASTPSCAIFDEEGSLKKVGHPFVGEASNKQARHAA